MSRFITAFLIGAGLCAAQATPSLEQDLAAKLQQDPNNIALLLKLAAIKIYTNGPEHDSASLDEAQSCYERVVAIDANNTTALYSLGVIGWTRVFAELRTARAQLAMEPETPGPLRDVATRAVLSAKYARTLNDSVADLERVLTIDPQNNDSMAYLNLVYRAKADLEDTAEASSQDIATADQWVQKTLATVRAKQEAGISISRVGPLPLLPPPPPPPPSSIRIGAAVQQANLTHQVPPVYPPLALQARIQGTVRFNAVIAKDGTIANLTVLSGHPILIQAALEAVKQWTYKPTMLNGEPVQVITTIDVNFALN